MKFVVYSLGCKVNQYEGLVIIKRLTELGHIAVDKIEWADTYILNSCTVTQEAEAKTRRLISRFARLNEQADILLIGCASQINDIAFTNPRIVASAGNANKLGFVEDYLNKCQSQKQAYFQLPAEYEPHIYPTKTRTRAYIKIQDGCNNFCSYCIVPYARGRSRSRELVDIYKEISATDSKEIIFTGIDISSYKGGLDKLISGLSKYPNKRFRLGSLEPNIINDTLLKVWREVGVCPHFHLSMQSGSNQILQAMNRRYTAEEYLSKLNIIRQYFPDAGITTDVIAGFPTETEQNHQQTMATIEQAQFSDIHVFPYSARKGTKAYDLPQIPMEVRKFRANEIAKLANQSRQNFLKTQLNKTYPVLIESDGSGFTPNYIKVTLNQPIQEGEIVNAKIKSISPTTAEIKS